MIIQGTLDQLDINDKSNDDCSCIVPEKYVSITSDDGLELRAYYHPSDEDSHLYLILVHGYT